MDIVMPRVQEEPSMALEAPREEETTLNNYDENEQLSSIPELNESIEVEYPEPEETSNIPNTIPPLHFNPRTSILTIGDNPDTTVIQSYENDITNDMQNQSLIDLLDNEESTINSSIENEISQTEFQEILRLQDILLNLLGNYQFEIDNLKKAYKRTQETLIDLYQNPTDYNTTFQTAVTLYTAFLYEMEGILQVTNNKITIRPIDETRLTLKWYNLAMLLRSKQLSHSDVIYLTAQSFNNVDQILQYLSSNPIYWNLIQQTEINIHNDETARRRREQRHIYFRNLNARRRGTAGRRPAIQ